MGKYREPQSANEAALQNLLGEQNELREPQSPVEFYLQELIEQGGGGGGSYNFPKIDIDGTGNTLIFEDDDYIGDDEKRTPFYIDNSAYSHVNHDASIMLIPQKIREGEWWKIRVAILKGCRIGFGYAKKTSDSPVSYNLYESQSAENYSNQISLDHLLTIKNPPNDDIIRKAWSEVAGDDILVPQLTGNTVQITSFSNYADTWAEDKGFVTQALVVDDISNMMDQLLQQVGQVLIPLATNTKGTTFSRYFTMDTMTANVLIVKVKSWEKSINENHKAVYVRVGGRYVPITNVDYYLDENDNDVISVSFRLKFVDTSTSYLIYTLEVFADSQNIYFQCTCHEATSLM